VFDQAKAEQVFGELRGIGDRLFVAAGSERPGLIIEWTTDL
jgi:hypothetical protein